MWKTEEDMDGLSEKMGEMEDGSRGGEVRRKPRVVASAVQATPGIRKATLTD